MTGNADSSGDDWRAWIERYRAALELNGFSAVTVANHLWALAGFVEWAEELLLSLERPGSLTLELLADYRRHRIERVNARGKRDSAMTVNLHISVLRSFLRFLAERGAVSARLLAGLRPLKAPKLLPRHTPDHAQVMRMLARVPCRTPIQVRDRAIIEVLYSSAIRRKELVDLRLGDLDFAAGVIHVRRGKGAKGRVVPVGEHAAAWLRSYLESARPALCAGRHPFTDDDQDRVFLTRASRPMTGSLVRWVVSRWAQAAGLGLPVSPHGLRRSCATEMIRNGAGTGHVKEILGHESFSSLGPYVRLVAADLKEAVKRFHPRERADVDDSEPGPVPEIAVDRFEPGRGR